MARIHAENADFALNSVQLEDELNSVDLNIQRDVPEVTAFADTAKAHVAGKYGWGYELAGSADFDDAQGDATIFAALANATAIPLAFDPTGTAAAADNPNYDGVGYVERYSISARVTEAVTYRATVKGDGTLTRAVA